MTGEWKSGVVSGTGWLFKCCTAAGGAAIMCPVVWPAGRCSQLIAVGETAGRVSWCDRNLDPRPQAALFLSWGSYREYFEGSLGPG